MERKVSLSSSGWQPLCREAQCAPLPQDLSFEGLGLEFSGTQAAPSYLSQLSEAPGPYQSAGHGGAPGG